MSMEAQIKSAVERLANAKQEHSVLQYDEDDEQELRPPASVAELRELEERAGFILPRSYRTFLALHNGWTGFSGDVMILPTSEHSEPWVQQRIADIRCHLAEFDDPAVLDHAFMVALGQDQGHYVYLNTSSRTGDEYEVVHAHLVDGVVGKYPDFARFLEAKAEVWETLVARTR